MTEVNLASIQALSEKLQAMDLKLNSLQEAQNSASGVMQHLSAYIMSAVKTIVQNTEKLNALQDFRIRIVEKEARRKNLVILGNS
ncbi:hypothetical protein QYM36_006056, partial [Artemia franciscana]